MTDKPEMISSYSRAQAVEDGVLIDVTETAKEAGWKWPVAMTDTAYAHVIPSEDVAKRLGCDTAGRLWDVLWMSLNKARVSNGQSTIMFEVILPQTPRSPQEIVKFKAVCGPGDTPEPVITIMMPGED